MNWTALLDAALLGGIFGGVGAIVGTFIAQLFPKKMRSAVIIAAVAIAIVGHRFVDVSIFGGTPSGEELEQKITATLESENPMLAENWSLLKAHEPAIYQELLNSLESGLEKGLSESEMANLTRSHFERAYEQRFLKLNDSELVNVVNLLAEQLEVAGNLGMNEFCANTMKGAPLGAVTANDEFYKIERDMARVVFQSDLEGGKVVTEEVVLQAASRAIEILVGRYGDQTYEVFAIFDRDMSAPAQTCAVFSDYLSALMREPFPTNGQIFRTTLTME